MVKSKLAKFEYEAESEYEEIAIPKKHQSSKRKGKISKAAHAKRAKPNPQPCIPKKSAPRANNQLLKKRHRASMDAPEPPPGPPPMRFKPNQTKPSSIAPRR